MESPDHVKLAYNRYLQKQQEADMEKSAAGLSKWLSTVGKAMGSRMWDSAKAVPRDLMMPFKMFSRDPNAFANAIKQDSMMHAGGGSLIRPFATNIGASARRFDKFSEMDDAAFNQLLEQRGPATFWGGINPLNRDLNWLNRLDDAGLAALQKGRAAVRSGGAGVRPERERINFLRSTVGKDMDDSAFRHAYKRYGRPGEGGWAAQEFGRRAGVGLGGAGIFLGGTSMPYTALEWAGGASAIPGASERAMQGAQEAAADQLHKFRSGGFMDRMGNAFNPQRGLEDLYSPENIGRGGLAHYYMYGPGKSEAVNSPGFFSYAGELLHPFLGTGVLDRTVRSKAMQQFQKSGSYKKANTMTATEQLELVKAAMGPLVGTTSRNVVRKVIPAGAMGDAVSSLADDVARKAAPVVPAGSVGSTSGIATTTSATSSTAAKAPSGIKQRFNNFKSLFRNPETRLPAALTAGFTASLPLSFLLGRATVNNGAYDAGYGAGSAFAAQQFYNMPWYQRMGAAAFPDYAMNKLFQQYPQLMEAYSNRSLPGRMRAATGGF